MTGSYAISYRLTGTYSKHSGATEVCADRRCSARIDRRFSRTGQWSFLVEAFGRVPGTERLSYDLGVAVDIGNFREERVGARLGLTWRGLHRPGGGEEK